MGKRLLRFVLFTVLQDGILKPETSSAAIFAKVTEILAVWENS